MADTKSGFIIDDKHYPCPTLDTIDLDEERILFIYADTVVSDFMPLHPEATEEDRRTYSVAQNAKYRNPDFKRALAHIAYRREHRELSDQEIQEAIGKINALQGDLAMMLAGDVEDPTRDSPKPLENESESPEPSPPSSSGSPTATSSDPADESPELTGTSESDISSPATQPIALVS